MLNRFHELKEYCTEIADDYDANRETTHSAKICCTGHSVRKMLSGRPSSKNIDNQYDNRAELKTEYEQALKQLEEAKTYITKTLSGLTGVKRQIIALHYIDRLNWNEIGERLDIHRTTVKRIHDKTITKIMSNFVLK